MGNREELVAGATRCLFAKGYAGTTARDVATASGVSLAAIGYHFGSKEALLQEALQQALADWGDRLEALLSAEADFVTTWTRVIDSFAENRQLWALQFELLAQFDREPALRESFAEAGRRARAGLAELVDRAPANREPAEQAMGAFYQTLLAGLAAMWLADPASVPSSADLLVAMRAVTATNPA